MEDGFAAVDQHFAEQRAYIDFGYARLDGRFDRFERKLDQFIDVQLQTNQLTDRRLRALEAERGSA
jgi:hypothetical protein